MQDFELELESILIKSHNGGISFFEMDDSTGDHHGVHQSNVAVKEKNDVQELVRFFNHILTNMEDSDMALVLRSYLPGSEAMAG